jgi:putative ABC transport system permease protein
LIRVKNKPVIRHLADRSLRLNKSRNLIAILAIALTSLLFTTLFTMGIGAVESLQTATMRQSGGDSHAVIKYIGEEDFAKIKAHPLIKEMAYTRPLADDVANPELLKRRTEFWYKDKTGQVHEFIHLAKGHQPAAANEVIADSKTLQLLGVPLEIGAPVTLQLVVHGAEVQRDFILSGWWESDPVLQAGQILSSRAYVETHEAELQHTYRQDGSITGSINAYLLFGNSLNLQGKLAQVIVDSGYSQDEKAANYLASNVNWAYLNANFTWDAGTLLAAGSAALLVGFTGYLIIYNIFQISVLRDIHFYGLLKTIGTTGRQLRRMLRRQAWQLSVIGIPFGLAVGFIVGKALVPMLIRNTNFADSQATVSPSPWIFIGSALFALLTVFISIHKPGRIASAVSPLEAIRFTDGSGQGKHKLKKTNGGARMPRLALSNLGRNHKRTALVLISLSLSLVLLNTTFTLSRSIDMDKYLSKFSDTDFLLAHADYFRYDFTGLDNEVTPSFIASVEAQPGFEAGGRLYGAREAFSVEDSANPAEANGKDERGHYRSAVYGLEPLPFSRLALLDGELDPQKLASGKYILEGVSLDDYGKPQWQYSHFKVGDTVTIHPYAKDASTKDTSYGFTVLGHVGVNYYAASDRLGWEYTFYLPADKYTTMLEHPAVMSYAFNVTTEQEKAMEQFLHRYTDTVEPVMNYSSKFTVKQEFDNMQKTLLSIGGILSLIIGLIGVLNFINAILTGMITRRKEFAMLQSIGMTTRQLKTMLIYEGFYYVLGAAIISLLLSVLFSWTLIRPLCSTLWLLSYHFVLWPVLVVLPVLLLLGWGIPMLAYAATSKQSLVERLREAE